MFNHIKRKTAVSILALMLFLSYFSMAQESNWAKDLTATLGEVGWIEQSNDGLIVAAGAKGLLALDNNTGEEVWHNKELKAVQKGSFQNIDGLPLFYAEYSPIVGKTRGILINSISGEILYDTKDDDYRIKTYHLLPEQQVILFEMTKGPSRLLMSFSLKTMKKEWIANLGEIKGLIGKIGNAAARLSFIDHGPMYSKKGNVIVGVNAKVYCIDQSNGNIAWDMEADKKVNALVYSPLNNSIYMGVKKSKKLIVLNPDNGDDITPGKLKLKGSLIDITSDSKNNIVLVETEGFNLINPKTNDLIWKKSYKIEYLDEVIPFDKGYIAIGKDEKAGSISYVDNEGKKIWDSKVKGYTYYAATTKKGVLYISTGRSNILSFADGKDVWEKDVKFKTIPAVTYDEGEDKVVLFESGTGYKFDLTSGKMTVFAEDVELKEVDRKTALLAEYRPAGYVLHTAQHMSLLDQKGKVVYSNHYPELVSLNLTGLAQLGMDLAGVDIDVAGSMDNIKQLDRLSKGAYRSSNNAQDGTSKTQTVAGVYYGNSAGYEVTMTRYSNSKQTKDEQFILTKDGTNTRYIFMVNKDTGKTEKKIALKDVDPQYVIDEIDRRVFVCENNKMITSYQM